ncbi:uncharacterized protein LOC143290156 [Babylonia areolata]|uniref:uncharacterized protein LOC143290156 n=1 Tax=Babylonia areolata TaxID=304850 RepID=UPI003FD290E8
MEGDADGPVAENHHARFAPVPQHSVTLTGPGGESHQHQQSLDTHQQPVHSGPHRVRGSSTRTKTSPTAQAFSETPAPPDRHPNSVPTQHPPPSFTNSQTTSIL